MSEREKSALYPNANWDDCFEFAKNIADFNLKAVSYTEVAKKYGLTSTTTKSFTSKISSCKQFGLILTSGGSTVQLTETAKRLIFPIGETRSIELNCFKLPPLYAKLITSFDGKALPDKVTLGNILMNDHKIAKVVKDVAADCFLKSAEQLGLIQGGVLCYNEALEITNKENVLDVEKRQENTKQCNTQIEKQQIHNEESEYITQSIPIESGKVAKFIIPVDATLDDLLLLRDMFNVLLKRKFKLDIEQ